MRIFLLIILAWNILWPAGAQTVRPATSGWRVHGAYKTNNCIEQAGELIYVGNNSSLFSYNQSDMSIEILSRVTGLSDVNVQFLKYHQPTETLIIVYDNLNIDLVQAGIVYNIADVQNRIIIGEKKINNISLQSGKAYLACSFGILVLDIGRKRLVDSYVNLGANGSNLLITDVAEYQGSLYASTPLGIYRASLNSLNLSDYNFWSRILPASFSNQLEVFSNQLYAVVDSNIVRFDGNNWTPVNGTDRSFTSDLRVSSNRLLIVQQNQILAINNQGSTTLFPYRLVTAATFGVNNDLYCIAPDNYMFRINASNGVIDYLSPSGPYATTATRMAYGDKRLWIAGGSIGGFGVTGGWGPLYNNNKFYTIEQNNWYNFKSSTDPRIVNGRDFIDVCIRPSTQHAFVASLTSGVIEVAGTQVVNLFDTTNSELDKPAAGGDALVQVSGIAFDNDENMWMSNFAAVKPLVLRTAGGQWRAFSFPTSISPYTGFITVDDIGQKWMTHSKGIGLVVYNSGADILSDNDDQIKLLTTQKENGFLPSNNVLCITKDQDGALWIGTDQGLCIIDRPQNVFRQGQDFDARQIVIKTGLVFSNFLGTTQINCIRVDAANRKWIGTSNGVWLVSPDGFTIIHNFNMSNSPILSNIVYDIGIDEQSGEVFFATEKGLISFVGDATTASDKHNNVLVYPNPVTPAFDGLITISGLVNNAYVKVTDLKGQLVHETRANGGTATWNGLTFQNKRAATGVYLVYSSNAEGTETNVGKIVFIK
ncbi:MAG: T9SS type A sorting domain-containing protein [Bacteroidia bacterium]|jgi:hypothetical protein|nr:T9SS type A sorting domain-containing protein [Bacteroidia bacterium]